MEVCSFYRLRTHVSRPDASSRLPPMPCVLFSPLESFWVPSPVSCPPYRPLLSIPLMNMNHKRAVSNYHLTLKLENIFSHKIKFKHSHAPLNNGETSEKCIIWQFHCDVAIAEGTFSEIGAVVHHTPMPIAPRLQTRTRDGTEYYRQVLSVVYPHIEKVQEKYGMKVEKK